MTRKRFKKKLMSLGYSRNDLEKAFLKVLKLKIPNYSYETVYILMLEWLPQMSNYKNGGV